MYYVMAEVIYVLVRFLSETGTYLVVTKFRKHIKNCLNGFRVFNEYINTMLNLSRLSLDHYLLHINVLQRVTTFLNCLQLLLKLQDLYLLLLLTFALRFFFLRFTYLFLQNNYFLLKSQIWLQTTVLRFLHCLSLANIVNTCWHIGRGAETHARLVVSDVSICRGRN